MCSSDFGRGGQNVRLAAKLTGWKIDIKGGGGEKEDGKEGMEKLSTRVANALDRAGIDGVEKLKEMSDEEIKGIKGIGPKAVEEIKELLK